MLFNFKIPVLYFALFCIVTSCAQDKNPINPNTDYEIIVPELNNPWGFVFLPDSSILITEKEGKLIHYKNKVKTEVTGLPEIDVRGQGGLLDIVLHPDYHNTGWIYLSYTSPKGSGDGSNTAIIRAKLMNNTLKDVQLLYKAEPNTTKGQHFGSRIVFDQNNYLYFSIGDRGERDSNPQDLTRDGGKIYRLHDDGSIPKDNPFVSTPHAITAIYSYGHRNPQGMELHPETGALWSHEHGPKGGDELNEIQSGKNYGWPKVTFGKNYSGTSITKSATKEGMEPPLHHWTPSIAPSGMAFITSNAYGDWKGSLLVGSLKFQYLNRCVLKNNKVIKEERLLNGIGRVRSINQGPDGMIYVGVEQLGIVKLKRL